MDIRVYQKEIYSEQGIDRSLLKERLKLTPTQRLEEHIKFMEFVEELQKSRLTNSVHDQLQRNLKKT